MGDLKSFQARYIALRQRMIDDGIAKNLPIHSNDLHIISERLMSEGASFCKVTLPHLGKALDRGLVGGHFMCPAQFGLKRNTRLPTLCYGLFSRVFGEDGVLLRDPCIQSMQFLRQFLLFDSKLKYEPPVVMKEKAVREFSDRMAALRKLRIPQSHPVLIRAQKLLGEALRGLDLSDIRPGHGPGAVAERIDRFGRWDFQTWPVKAERDYPYLMYGTHSIRALVERGKGIRMTKNCRTRICLVPKDFKGPRLISAEGTVNQYLQQGQMKALMHYISSHWLLKRSIKLRDQTFNQKGAQSSLEDGTCTLDLSNASDTVSVALVWYLLKGVPRLRRQLMATRSDYAVYQHQQIKIAAFAPMGSATCFPVETLVFWSLTMASCQLANLNPGTLKKQAGSLSELSRRIRVFGDDIVVPEYALQTLMGTLQEVGCTVNESKTCYRTPFRESCGSEWFTVRGIPHDVSVIRNRLYGYETLSVKDHPVLLGLQRKMFLQGHHRTASLLLEWAREIWPTPVVSVDNIPNFSGVATGELLPTLIEHNRRSLGNTVARVSIMNFFEKEALALDTFSCGLGWWNEPDEGWIPKRSVYRWNVKYQRHEWRHPSPSQGTRMWLTGGYPRLLARLLGDQTDRIAILNRKVKMAWSVLPFDASFQEHIG